MFGVICLLSDQQKCPLHPGKRENLAEAILFVVGTWYVASTPRSVIIPFLEVLKNIQWITFFYLVEICSEKRQIKNISVNVASLNRHVSKLPSVD